MSLSLRKSLTFLHVDELREIADKLVLLNKGSKMPLIMRILHFTRTGEKLTAPKFPQSSCAKRRQSYLLEQSTLMLNGNYKNDLKTRLFFKKIIGAHFHFTAFGIDWLNERWMIGNPPTYQEFADMWENEYRKGQKTPALPKEEWAYIRFIQRYLTQSPDSTRDHLNKAWENERQKHKNIIKSIFDIGSF